MKYPDRSDTNSGYLSGLPKGSVSTFIKHKNTPKARWTFLFNWSRISHLFPFLSLLKVVDATSPAQADAGDPQRITARPVSKHDSEGWKVKRILFFFSCGEILYVLLRTALKYFRFFFCRFLPTDVLIFSPMRIYVFLSSPVLSTNAQANVNSLFTSWWQHGAWLLGMLMGILEYTEMNWNRRIY